MVWSRASRFKQLNDVDRIIGHMKLLEKGHERLRRIVLDAMVMLAGAVGIQIRSDVHSGQTRGRRRDYLAGVFADQALVLHGLKVLQAEEN